MLNFLAPVVLLFALLLGVVGQAMAQQTTVVTAAPSELVRELFIEATLSNAVTAIGISDVLVSLGYPNFLPPNLINDLLEDQAVPFALGSALGAQLSTFPLGSSAGGFSFTFDSSTGAFNRASESFGPLFAERALTLGRNRFNAGVNFQRVTFDTFEGKNLRTGEVQFFSEILAPFSEGELPLVYSTNTLNLELSANTVGVFASYGVTNNLDVGIAVPIVSVDMNAGLLNELRFFDGEPVGETTTFRGAAHATGMGDITLRGKYKFWDLTGGGLAAAVDLRLPTGDEANLLGIPGTQTELFLVMSTAIDRIAPHFNIGYTFSRGNDLVDDPSSIFLEPADEFNFSGGVDVSITPQVTIVGDVIVRTLRDAPKLREETSEVGTFREFRAAPNGNVNFSYGSTGVKINPWGTFIFSANLLFPLVESGLQDNLIPMFGGDYSF